MMVNIDLEPRYIEMLQPILKPLAGQVFVYGSRVKGAASKFSDLDLCYKGDFDKKVIRSIREQLRDSNLPIKVDLISYDQCTDEFKSLIKADLLEFKF
jgi:predicted nucleotidyltransferase